ncbi:MAG: hypothetical protein ACT4P2_15100 [Pseudomonadota bacterium]
MVGALLAALAACAEPPPGPLPAAGGHALVLGPDAGFDPARLPTDWWRQPRGSSGGFALADLDGIQVLRIDAASGALIGRRLAAPLLATPYLRWAWYLDPGAFGSGAGDGLDRGLRLVVGFKGGTVRGSQLTDRLFAFFGSDLPAHERTIEIAFGGVGAPRAENARQHLSVVSDRGMRRTLRPPASDQAGQWQIEAIDLAEIYAQLWPSDRLAEIEIGFIAVGGLAARLPAGVPASLGYIAEILLSR